jgi:hypothetical protein
MLDYQESLKRRGEKIHTSWRLLEYQKNMLAGRPTQWSCVAGYKYFFVSARGQFWLCSQVRTDKHILEITPEELVCDLPPKFRTTQNVTDCLFGTVRRVHEEESI